MTKSMLFQLNVGHMQRCYCELVTNAVYDNFQTPKAQTFSECKTSQHGCRNIIHLLQIHWSLGAKVL